MKIKVEVVNELLGNSTFWEGDSKDVDQIRNFPARQLAKDIAERGGSRRVGMWFVYEVKDENR